MFGYVKPYTPSLTIGDHEFYEALYCGVCQALKKETGWISTLTLNYDLVFLAMVRMLFGDKIIAIEPKNCVTHPIKKRPMVGNNPELEYAAAVCTVLTYYKLEDDIQDDVGIQKIPKFFCKTALIGAEHRVRFEGLTELVEDRLAALRKVELEKDSSIDHPAHLFGDLLGVLFAYGKEDPDYHSLYQFGYRLGKFIYIADAAEDYPKDLQSGNYNPFVLSYGETFDSTAKETIHTALMNILCDIEPYFKTFPYEKSQAVKRIVENIMYLGLPNRISFLLGKVPPKKLEPYEGTLP